MTELFPTFAGARVSLRTDVSAGLSPAVIALPGSMAAAATAVRDLDRMGVDKLAPPATAILRELPWGRCRSSCRARW